MRRGRCGRERGIDLGRDLAALEAAMRAGGTYRAGW